MGNNFFYVLAFCFGLNFVSGTDTGSKPSFSSSNATCTGVGVRSPWRLWILFDIRTDEFRGNMG